MDKASLIVAILSFVAAAAAAVYAFLADRRSLEANKLAKEANEQAFDFFSKSGASVRIKLSSVREGCHVSVLSVGRLPAAVKDVTLICATNGSVYSAIDEPGAPQPTGPLEATDSWEFTIMAHRLASASDLYSGSHRWSASAILGDDSETRSAEVSILHPDEPPLEEALTRFARRQNAMDQRLHHDEDEPTLEVFDALANEHEQMKSDLQRLRDRCDQVHGAFRGRSLSQLNNIERSYNELHKVFVNRRSDFDPQSPI